MMTFIKNLATDSILAILFWGMVLPFNSAAFAQPVNWHYPPCAQNETLDKYCASWLTDPTTGNQVCAPGQMKDICVPVTTPGNDNDLNNIQRCMKDGTVCVDTTPTKVINGYSTSLSEVGGCWQYRRDYTCSTYDTVNTCSDFQGDPKCEVWSRKCIRSDSLFGCTEFEIEYQCMTKAGSSHQVEYCGDRNICIGGVCWNTGYVPDQDFAKVITDMEAARQIGAYNSSGLDIFHGESAWCRSKRAAGLKNCCTKTGGAKTNNAVMGTVISDVTGYAVRAGSKFVLDSLYGDTVNWLSSGWSAAVGGNLPGGQGMLDSVSNPQLSIGAYGFSIGGTGSFLGTAGYQLGSVGIGGANVGIYFNPYAFAAAIAIQLVMSAMTCDEEEAKLALKRGAGLCQEIDDFCTQQILGVCITRRRTYCCYNSKLAKIINVQGRAQLGMGWGDTEDPTCNGFTAAQLKQVDFSKIDFSEFVGDVMAAVDTSHIQEDLQKMQGETGQKALESSCKRTYAAVNGDMNKIPAECAGLVP